MNRRQLLTQVLEAAGAYGGGAAPVTLPLAVNFSTLPDGALPVSLVGPTWAIASGKAINTPTTDGAELITNGTFTAWTGDTPDGWTPVGVSAPNREITQVDPANGHGGGGTGACNIYGDGATNIIIRQTVASATKRLRQTFSITKRTTGNGRGFLPESSFTAAGDFVVTSIVPSAATSIIQFYNLGAAIDNTIDNVSVQKVNFQTYFAYLNKTTETHVRVSAALRMTTYKQIGVFLNMDDPANPQNMVLAYIYDRNQSYKAIAMDKIVNGVQTNLVSVITFANNYGAGKELVLERLLGTDTFRLLYWRNDTTGVLMQFGLDQTVSDASIINNVYHGVLSTDPGISQNHAIDSLRIATEWHETFFVGDSRLTVTYGNAPLYFARETPIFEEYPTRVATSGHLMADVEAALPAAIAAWTSEPEYVFFNVGINNAATIVGNEAAFRTSMQNCLDLIHAAAADAKIYIMLVWARGNAAYQITVNAVDAEISTVLAANPTFCYSWADERVWLQAADDGAVMTSDGKHYSAAGCTEAARLGRVATGLS